MAPKSVFQIILFSLVLSTSYSCAKMEDTTFFENPAEYSASPRHVTSRVNGFGVFEEPETIKLSWQNPSVDQIYVGTTSSGLIVWRNILVDIDEDNRKAEIVIKMKPVDGYPGNSFSGIPIKIAFASSSTGEIHKILEPSLTVYFE